MPEPVPQRAAQQQHGQGCEVVGGHDPLQFPAARPEPRRQCGQCDVDHRRVHEQQDHAQRQGDESVPPTLDVSYSHMLETTTSFAGSGRRAITQRDLSPFPEARRDPSNGCLARLSSGDRIRVTGVRDGHRTSALSRAQHPAPGAPSTWRHSPAPPPRALPRCLRRSRGRVRTRSRRRHGRPPAWSSHQPSRSRVSRRTGGHGRCPGWC